MADNLNLYQNGREKSLVEWIQEQGEKVYKDIGKRTWRVPPIKFNVQNLREQVDVKDKDECICTKASVLGQLNLSDQEANRAENIVCSAFESLSDDMVNKGTGSAMFLISNFEYDNYLNKLSHSIAGRNIEEWTSTHASAVKTETTASSASTQKNRPVVKLPKDVAQRGELDMLILHQEAGVVLVQTKAVGYSFKSSNSDRGDCVQVAIKKAAVQLLRDHRVMLHVMEDLHLDSTHVKAVVALPNIPRYILEQEMGAELKLKMLTEFNLDPDFSFLCEEDFKTEADRSYKALEKWWKYSLMSRSKGITLLTMQQIAYRTVGLLSTVSVWSFAQPQVEVRDLNEAAWETGNRYTQVVLSPQQVQLLKREDKYFYLWGPPGSGKTLLLSLKGRQWLRSGFKVLILNTRLGSRGRTVGQIIERTINKTKGLKEMAIRVDLDLSDTEDSLSSINSYNMKNPGQLVNFILDEVVWVKETEKLLSLLKKKYPNSMIWSAGMLPECQPTDFESDRLKYILRCPPWVQRVLRAVDNRNERCQLYHLDSAQVGLPTDGPHPYFIIHSEHGDPSIQPYDCAECGRKLCNFLLNELGMKEKVNLLPDKQQAVSCKPASERRSDCTRPCTSKLKRVKKPCERTSCCDSSARATVYPRLSFSDAVMPVSVPEFWHHFSKRGYHALSTKALAQDMVLIGSRALCQELFNAGVPLKVEEDMVLKSDGQNLENYFVICPIGAVHGLEYKVVVCVPSEFALDEYTEINPGIVTGKMAQKIKVKRTKFAEDYLTTKDQLSHEQHSFSGRNNEDEPKTDKIRISTHVSDEGAPDDCLYESVTDNDLSVSSDGDVCHDSIKSAMLSHPCLQKSENRSSSCCTCLHSDCVKASSVGCSMQANESNKGGHSEATSLDKHLIHAKTKRDRCGSALKDIRSNEFRPHERQDTPLPRSVLNCDSIDTMASDLPGSNNQPSSAHPSSCTSTPSLTSQKSPASAPLSSSPAGTETAIHCDEIKAEKEVCSHTETDRCVCKYFRPEELTALDRLSPWNKAYVLMCASRCTSVLVLVLP